MTAALLLLKRIPATGWIIIAVSAAFLLSVGYCSQRAVQAERGRQAVVTAKTERKASSARETASVERLNDTTIINAREKDLSNAVNSLPDARPSPRRVALACERLKHQASALPDVCRN